MSTIQKLRRFGLPLMAVALIAGCSSSGSSRMAGSTEAAIVRSDDCTRNRGSCIYEGRYEPGEKDYAEEEAKRLNQASIRRLRRGAWR